MPRIYLDNNATTHLDPGVLEAMAACWTTECGNASSQHREGRSARRLLEDSRETVAELLDALPHQVIFTAGGTEANNLAIAGLIRDLPGQASPINSDRRPTFTPLPDTPHQGEGVQGASGPGPGHLVTSSIEHPSVLGCFEQLERRGFDTTYLPVTAHGLLEPDSLVQSVRPDTQLVSVMLANNETGAIQPVERMAHLCRARGVPFHVDAVQAVGRMPVSFRRLGVTSLSLSAHKFHGPTGAGCLIINDTRRLRPLLAGGHQESGIRPGTESVPLAVGLAHALQLSLRRLDADTAHMRKLRDEFHAALSERFGELKCNGPLEHRLCNTLSLTFPGIDAQAAVIALDLQGIACSTGSACSSGAATASHVLLAMGLSEPDARSSLRFSFSRFTTRAEVEFAVEKVTEVVAAQPRSSSQIAVPVRV